MATKSAPTVRAALFLLAALPTGAASAEPRATVPLLNAHAHNDYMHARPLFDALDHGFTSVEADVYPVAGNLLVAHDRIALNPDRTLESLYLAPLAKRTKKNNGHVYPQASRFFLLIDIKADSQQTYKNLQPLLSKYRSMLTVVENGKTREGAVTIVLTGPKLPTGLDKIDPRYVALDGRLLNLNSHAPQHVMPWISDDWTKHFTWTGAGPMPAGERGKLQDIVKKAHAAGRIVRFWKTPENETTWRELRTAGVDLLNSDDLPRLEKFLRAR
jgi:hypothetical protein